MKMWRRKLRMLGGMLAAIAVAVAVAWCLIPPYGGKLDEYSTSSKICDRQGRVMRIVLDKDDLLSDPIQQNQTGDWAAKALIAAEDKRFLEHGGVDILAVCRAALSNLLSGRIVSGASTITMLVGKLTEPRSRNMWTKIVQASHARYLEKHLTKVEILEQYLNRAPFGGNIIGIEAAAQRYFAKSTADLTLSEAALLVGLPQSPSRLRPDLHFDRAINRRNYVLDKMKACGLATDEQIRNALAQEMSVEKRTPPFLAPHFCDLVSRTHPHQPSIITSLDLDIQALAEKALRARLEELKEQGITGGAIVVLDVKTGRVRAMVGSPDYANIPDSGQVNCAISSRSPGSTLKPFIYAMAMDEGMCSPESIVNDAPVNFAGYKPKNFSGDYCGRVSIRQALVESLNIPALLYVQKLGLEHVVLRLRSLGFSTLNEAASEYGLSIAIGTCEATLLDLVNAYACIARKGIYCDASFIEEPAVSTKTRLFSEEAAYMITDMLSGDERAYDADGHVADVRLPRIAWKTGTSAGNRDAWCVAYNPEYVVGAWIGNASGQGAPALIGCSAATPVATGLFRRLYPKGDAPWFDRPVGLKSRGVCSSSGLAPNDSCPSSVPDDFIPGITATGVCPLHGNSSEEEQRKGGFEIGRGTVQVIEDPGTGETPVTPKRRLQIMSPAADATFHLVDDMPLLKQEIGLASTADKTTGTFFWFVDGELFRTTVPGESVSWPLRNGRHVIACSDASGSGDSVEITVE